MNKLTKLVGCLAHPLYRSGLLLYGTASGVEHEPILRRMNCRTVVDIGANRGQFALVARCCFPGARIISFEPLEKPAAQFSAIFAKDEYVVLHKAAISPQSGGMTIHISRRDDSSSLLPITATQTALFPGTAEGGTATIRVGPLCEFASPENIEPDALLKLDVQGYELQALAGCEDLLDRFAYVYVECSFVELYAGQALADEVVAWLRERGFQLNGVYNMVYDRSGRAVQADFLFVRN